MNSFTRRWSEGRKKGGRGEKKGALFVYRPVAYILSLSIRPEKKGRGEKSSALFWWRSSVLSSSCRRKKEKKGEIRDIRSSMFSPLLHTLARGKEGKGEKERKRPLDAP